jgi:hypothetical protein
MIQSMLQQKAAIRGTLAVTSVTLKNLGYSPTIGRYARGAGLVKAATSAYGR